MAHFGMVEVDAENSLVTKNSHFIHVIGGQVNASDTPGGTNAVYMASGDPTTGNVETWKALTSTLSDSPVGPTVTIYNGYIYIVGGLTDGALGSWTKSTNPFTMAISFATAFGFCGNLYVLNGDPNGSSDPTPQTTFGLPDVRFARANNVVGT